MRAITATVDQPHDGSTVYRVLKDQLKASDTIIRRAKRTSGALLLDGAPTRTDAIVACGAQVTIDVSDSAEHMALSRIEPQEGPVSIAYADQDLLVVEKPAGIVMHPCAGHHDHTLGNYLMHYLLREGLDCRLHPIHRLDKGTSGLVVFALNSHAQARLQDQMHSSEFERTYLALCLGQFERAKGTVDAPIERINWGNHAFGIVEGGKRAVTRYEVVDEARPLTGPVSCVRFTLETGRTHQIRIHMASLGHPLVGDADYGDDRWEDLRRKDGFEQVYGGIDRPALHSHILRMTHPVTSERLELTSAFPADIQGVLDAARGNGGC